MMADSCMKEKTHIALIKWLYFVADVLLTVEHVKHVLSIEVQKGDSLLLSADRYLFEENDSLGLKTPSFRNKTITESKRFKMKTSLD